MKKVLLIVTAVILAVAMLSLPAMANGWDIEKSVTSDMADLGDHITFNVSGTAAGVPAKVTDSWSSDLTYIPGTLNLTGASVSSYSISDHYFVAYLNATGPFTITFDVQVTEVQATPTMAYDTARLYEWTGSAYSQVALDTEAITLDPYEGFEKVATIVWEGNPNGDIEVNELVAWNMTITVPNNFAWNITDAVLKDNLGGELGLAGDQIDNDRALGADDGGFGDLAKAYNTIPLGNDGTGDLSDLIIKTKGKTKKVQFKIVDIDIAALGSLNYVLGIFTDKNPSKWGHQCYTSTYEDHPLNSGATLKFTDPETGLQLSAHTNPILIDVVPPISPP